MPPGRRLLLLAACAAIPRSVALAAPEPTPAQAAAFVRQAGNELAAIIDAPATPAARRRQIGLFLDRVVDIPAVARFCLGRFWRRATPAQQAEYEHLFHGILLDSVMARVGDYRTPQGGGPAQGMHVAIGHAEPRGGDIYIPTTVARPGAPPAQVTWVVRPEPTGPRIVDLIAEGTSLRITVRADYASFLNRHAGSLPALFAAMRQQITAAEAAPSVGGR
ncbi:MAG: MlaC/ttg2D family ABC transporter substrate-binding protein [Acetobacteraceae bacterium]